MHYDEIKEHEQFIKWLQSTGESAARNPDGTFSAYPAECAWRGWRAAALQKLSCSRAGLPSKPATD